jgi:Tol biopolymer transport system component
MIAKADLSGARVAAGHNLQTWALYWSPDNRQIATGLSEVNVTDLGIIPVDSGAPRLLTNTAAFEVPSSWSSSGNRLTYTLTGEGSALRGAIMDPATGASTHFPASANATPIARWSPDGKQLTLEALNGDAGIWIADSTGSNARQLTTERLETDPRWSPDGTEIAYVSRRTGTGDIWVVPAAGGTSRQAHPRYPGRRFPALVVRRQVDRLRFPARAPGRHLGRPCGGGDRAPGHR